MSVSTLVSDVTYTATGASPLAIPFPFTQASDLVVKANGVIVAFNMSGDPLNSAASVTLVTPLAVAGTIYIQRVVPYTQPAHFGLQGIFSPKAHEAGFDRATMQIQQVKALSDTETAARIAADAAEQAARVSADVGIQAQIATTLALLQATGGGGTVPGDSAVIATGTTAALAIKDHLSKPFFDITKFGAVADGTYGFPHTWTAGTNVTANIQAAIDAAYNAGGGVVWIPAGIWTTDTLFLRSGVYLLGAAQGGGNGMGAILYSEMAGSAHGTPPVPIVRLGSVDGEDVSYAKVGNLKFVAANYGVAAIASHYYANTAGANENGVIGTCYFHDITHVTSHGFMGWKYHQACMWERWISAGSLEQMFFCHGNWNRVRQFDKEAGYECPFGDGHTSYGAEPYIQIEAMWHDSTGTFLAADDWVFEHILVEQIVAGEKTDLIKLAGANIDLRELWFEGSLWPVTPGVANPYVGNVVRFQGQNLRLRGRHNLSNGAKLAIAAGSDLIIENLDGDGDETQWNQAIVFDDLSSTDLVIENLRCRGPRNFPAFANTPGVKIGRGDVTRYYLFDYDPPRFLPPAPGTMENLLVNPSFELADFGYTVSIGGGVTFPQSEMGPGRMLRVAGNSGTIDQYIDIPAEMVGRYMTIGFKGKIATAPAAGQAAVWPHVSGPGGLVIEYLGGNAIVAAGEWYESRTVFKVQAAGVHAFGVGTWQSVGSDAVFMADDLYVCTGDVPSGMSPRLRALELAPIDMTYTYRNLQMASVSVVAANAMPDRGTWRKGDRVINSNPVVGQPKGWVRITNGTGNVLNTDWVSEGNL